MAQQYDLIVIGTGGAATAAALACRKAGWSVAVIDALPYGGTCPLRGCLPKKVLVGVAEAVDLDRRLHGKGVAGGAPSVDWRALIAFKRTFTDPVPAEREREFSDNGIVGYRGLARFAGRNAIEVGGERLEGGHILIAIGAQPVPLGIPGQEHVRTSNAFMELESLPERIVLVGGGYIASEFSHIAARAGARVTVLQGADRILTQFDPGLVEKLTRKSREIGIAIRLGARVEAVEKAGERYRVIFTANGRKDHVEADIAIHAAGRAPDLESLHLDTAGVERNGHRLRLNEYLQSATNPAVYAAGDASGMGLPLTPVASYEGDVAATNMLTGNTIKPRYLGIPSVAFTIPPLARVGLLEEEAKRQNLKFSVHQADTSTWYNTRRVAEDCSGYKVLIEEGSGRILGAHLLGPHAEELINLFGLAIRNGLSAADVKGIFAYPTAASDLAYML